MLEGVGGVGRGWSLIKPPYAQAAGSLFDSDLALSGEPNNKEETRLDGLGLYSKLRLGSATSHCLGNRLEISLPDMRWGSQLGGFASRPVLSEAHLLSIRPRQKEDKDRRLSPAESTMYCE